VRIDVIAFEGWTHVDEKKKGNREGGEDGGKMFMKEGKKIEKEDETNGEKEGIMKSGSGVPLGENRAKELIQKRNVRLKIFKDYTGGRVVLGEEEETEKKTDGEGGSKGQLFFKRIK